MSIRRLVRRRTLLTLVPLLALACSDGPTEPPTDPPEGAEGTGKQDRESRTALLQATPDGHIRTGVLPTAGAPGFGPTGEQTVPRAG